jgi:hypothetical protein
VSAQPSSIQHKPPHTGETGFAFDDSGQRVPVVEFDFAALEDEAERNDRERVERYNREKLGDFVRFACDAILSGNPSAEVAGRRAYFFAFLLKQPPFVTQAELSKHLGLSKGAISQQLNSFLLENPLLARQR